MLACAFRYAPSDRTLLDVYAPSTQPANGRLLPVALFCHGGVWAHGKDSVESSPCLLFYQWRHQPRQGLFHWHLASSIEQLHNMRYTLPWSGQDALRGRHSTDRPWQVPSRDEGQLKAIIIAAAAVPQPHSCSCTA